MPHSNPPYASPAPYWYRPPLHTAAGGILRLVVGVLVVLLLLVAIRAVLIGTGEGTVPWPDAAGALGIAISVFIGFAILAFVFAVMFGLVLPALSGKGVDWMNPARWATFEAMKDLKIRYARGEIPRDDYLRILQDLEPGGAAAEVPPPTAPK